MNGKEKKAGNRPAGGSKNTESKIPGVRRKKHISVCMALLLAVCTGLAGCGKSDGGGSARGNTVQSTSKSVNDVLEEGVQDYEEATAQGSAGGGQEGGAGQEAADNTADASKGGGITPVQSDGDGNSPADGTDDSRESADSGAQKDGAGSGQASAEEVDVDLTTLSSTIVYSEVYNMMSEPESYIGKTVRMNGTYVVYHAESTGINYFACIIQDATACCSQGMEFVLNDTYTYPKDYPQEGEEIVVEGTFDTYMEDGYMYCTLRDARLVSG